MLGAREIVALLRADAASPSCTRRSRAPARADDRDAARAPRRPAHRALRKAGPRPRAGARKSARRSRAIIDGRDLIDIAERALLRPLDAKAQAEIAKAAKRVSLVTAISPRAILDSSSSSRRSSGCAGASRRFTAGGRACSASSGSPRSIGAHLAITGGMAVGDSLLQQVVGHGIASKISARMGEGVLNGLLTARVGLSALAVCRPGAVRRRQAAPGVADVAPFLFGGGKDA